jgi:hypothetical protein
MPDGCKDSLLPNQEYAPKIRVRVRQTHELKLVQYLARICRLMQTSKGQITAI